MNVNLTEVAPLVLVVDDVSQHVPVRKCVSVQKTVLVDGPEMGSNVVLVLFFFRDFYFEKTGVTFGFRARGKKFIELAFEASQVAAYMM